MPTMVRREYVLSIEAQGFAMAKNRIDELLRKVPVSRRNAVKALLIGTFVAPVVTSFPLDGRFTVDQAMAGLGDTTTIAVAAAAF